MVMLRKIIKITLFIYFITKNFNTYLFRYNSIVWISSKFFKKFEMDKFSRIRKNRILWKIKIKLFQKNFKIIHHNPNHQRDTIRESCCRYMRTRQVSADITVANYQSSPIASLNRLDASSTRAYACACHVHQRVRTCVQCACRYPRAQRIAASNKHESYPIFHKHWNFLALQLHWTERKFKLFHNVIKLWIMNLK